METDKTGNHVLFSELRKLKLIQFVEEICLNKNVSDDDLPDEFLKRFVEVLFSIGDCVETLKRRLHKIIGAIVEVGVACRSKLKADKNIKLIERRLKSKFHKKRKLDVPLDFLKDIEYSDPRFEKLVLLYQIDKKIETLSQDKMEVYEEIFKPSSQNVQLVKDSNLENDHHIEENSSETAVNSSSNVFKNKTVNKVLELESAFLTIKPELLSDGYENQQKVPETNNTVMNDEIGEKSGSWKGSSSSLDSSVKSNSVYGWTQTSLNSPVVCLKHYKDLCIVGCLNGDLAFVSVKYGTVKHIYEMHTEPITSLLTWNKRVISSSLDKSVKCFDMTLSKVKKACLKSPIESITDDGRGVVYCGTSSGHVHRFNILPMTEIGSSVQVSSQAILGLKIVSHYSQLLLIVSAKGRPLTIRDAESGVLIRSLDINNLVTFDIISGQPDTLMGVTENKIYSLELGNKTVVKTRPFLRTCVSALIHKDELYVLTNEGNIHTFSKDLQPSNIVDLTSTIGEDQVSTFSAYKEDCIIFLKNQLLLMRFKPDFTVS